jgi:hypothetical protein
MQQQKYQKTKITLSVILVFSKFKFLGFIYWILNTTSMISTGSTFLFPNEKFSVIFSVILEENYNITALVETGFAGERGIFVAHYQF